MLIRYYIGNDKFRDWFMNHGGGFDPVNTFTGTEDEFIQLPLRYVGGELISTDAKRDLYQSELWKIDKINQFIREHTLRGIGSC